MDDDLTTFLETAAMIASCNDQDLESFLEACARAYCDVHNTVLVECTIEAEVRDKEPSN